MNTGHVGACFGRRELMERLLEHADERKCVLLFGGRQAGKTTLLRYAEAETIKRVKVRHSYGDATLAVYVDLMRLRYDAGPPEFYRFLLECTTAVLSRVGDGDGIWVTGRDGEGKRFHTIEEFLQGVGALLQEQNRVQRIVFLLDEAGRVLGRRFPRAFQDNLFSMLYVDTGEVAERVALVFSGAQELAKLSEDETSPLGSRADQLDLVNLKYEAVCEFVAERLPMADAEVARCVFGATGGHAGLGARFIERCAAGGVTGAEEALRAMTEVESRSRTLFGHWIAHLSDDARVVLESIEKRRVGLLRRELAGVLADSDRDRFGAERTWHELQYVGVCSLDDEGRLRKCNESFWRYYREFDPIEAAGTHEERRVWDRIGETEISLRELVYRKYGEKWPGKEFQMMRKVLGPEWKKVDEVRQKATYRLSPDYVRTWMECMYLGQLGVLMEHNQAWDLFKDMFVDKRGLSDMLRDIYPVRNDIAHFARGLPPKELARCDIACDDILVIVRQASEERGDS